VLATNQTIWFDLIKSQIKSGKSGDQIKCFNSNKRAALNWNIWTT